MKNRMGLEKEKNRKNMLGIRNSVSVVESTTFLSKSLYFFSPV